VKHHGRGSIKGLSVSEISDEVEAESGLLQVDQRTLVQRTNVVAAVTVVILSILRWAIGPAVYLPVGGIAIILLCFCNGIYLARGGSPIVGARLIILAVSLDFIYGTFFSGGFAGPIVLLVPVVPALAFLLSGSRAGWIAAVVMVFSLFLLLALHFFEVVPRNPLPDGVLVIGRFIALSSSGLLVIWVIWAFAANAAVLGQRNKLLANTDHLTGLPNRRFSENFLNQEILRARRSEENLSLIIADVDHFKRYNDVNGHQAGDVCLQRVADAIRLATRRPADIVGRLGGEEFIAVLPNTDSEGAQSIAECMRQALLDQRIPCQPGKPEFVSMTLGVTTFRGKEIESSSGMLRLADQALYQGKEQGRNAVVVHLPLSQSQA
jgi:diguanylate cyclase (GGDEF)-like protein